MQNTYAPQVRWKGHRETQYEETTQQNDNRVRKNLDFYRMRQAIIEHVFGTVKRQWGYDHILLKGLEKTMGSSELYTWFTIFAGLSTFGDKRNKKVDKIIFFFNFGCQALCSGLYKPNKKSIQKPYTLSNSGYWMMKKRFLHELTLWVI